MCKRSTVLTVFVLITLAACTLAGSGDNAEIGADYTSPAVGTLAYVPSGTFQRDSDPANTSAVSAFRMSRFEITRAQFVAVTGLPDPSATGSSTGIDDPVQQASWYHALLFCNILSLSEGLIPVYSIAGSTDPSDWGTVPTSTNTTWNAAIADWAADGYRLPTEMEWMWAAMGARGGESGYLKAFAGSTGTNGIGDYAWYDTNSSGTTHPVGTRLPNELGIYDLSGNVLEWCWDKYADGYPTGAQADYRGTDSGGYRVTHGGSWAHDSTHALVGDRISRLPYSNMYGFLGFRVVRR